MCVFCDITKTFQNTSKSLEQRSTKVNMGDTKTEDEVREIIKTAKLHESELTEVTQILRFPASHNQNLKLFLLDEVLMKEIESGNDLVIKGDLDESVILCTKSKTYDVKEAETSNSILLVPDLLFASSTGIKETTNDSMQSDSDSSFEKSDTSLNKSSGSNEGDRIPRQILCKDISNTFFSYYELKPCKPRFSKLRKLLENNKYQGPELEYCIDKSELLKYNDLVDRVQASAEELDQEIKNIKAVKVDGYYRMLEFSYEFRVLTYMLDLIEENSWPLNRISKELTLDSLKQVVPLPILEAMFEFYTTESEKEDDEQYYEYRQSEVCGFLARVLLNSVGKFNYADFLQAWRDSVPEGMVADEAYLSSIAVVDRNKTPHVISSLCESDLPDDINQRLKVLFSIKTKWTIDEIKPYIGRYATEKLDVNALLTKYARASTCEGVRVYSAKHML